MRPDMIPAKVINNTPLTDDIIQLQIEPQAPFDYQAGDYLTLGFEQGDESAAKDFHRFKPLSIANAPEENTPLELHIRLNQKDDADQAWMQQIAQLKAGDTVWINGPFEQYRLDDNLNQPVILIAGGTGFSPMKALLQQLLADSVQVPIYFYWGAKTADEFYQLDWLQNQAQQHPNLQVIPVLSESDASTMRHGLVHQAVLKDFPDLSDKRVYLCGPWPMVQAAKEAFQQAGLPESQFN